MKVKPFSKKKKEHDLLVCKMRTPWIVKLFDFLLNWQNPCHLQVSLAKAKTTYIMMFPEWLSVGDSEESDANLHEENTHNKAVNFSHGLDVTYFSAWYQLKSLNSNTNFQTLLLTVYLCSLNTRFCSKKKSRRDLLFLIDFTILLLLMIWQNVEWTGQRQ